MATYDEVLKALDDIAQIIETERQAFIKAKARIQTASNNLAAISTDFADVNATITGYTPTGEFESWAKDLRTKMGTDYGNLKAEIDLLIAEF